MWALISYLSILSKDLGCTVNAESCRTRSFSHPPPPPTKNLPRKTLITTNPTLEYPPPFLNHPLSPKAMGIAFDYAPDRPEHIDTILNGLDRYNPETTTVFQDYVTQQCEDRTYDCYANLALLKL